MPGKAASNNLPLSPSVAGGAMSKHNSPVLSTFLAYLLSTFSAPSSFLDSLVFFSMNFFVSLVVIELCIGCKRKLNQNQGNLTCDQHLWIHHNLHRLHGLQRHDSLYFTRSREKQATHHRSIHHRSSTMATTATKP